jgi:signal transduction histidine kinase
LPILPGPAIINPVNWAKGLIAHHPDGSLAALIGAVALAAYSAGNLLPVVLPVSPRNELAAVAAGSLLVLVLCASFRFLVGAMGNGRYLMAVLAERAQTVSIGMMSEGVLQEVKREIAHVKLRAAILMVQAQQASLTPDGIDSHRQTFDLHFDLLENMLDKVRRHLEDEEESVREKVGLRYAIGLALAAKADLLQKLHIEVVRQDLPGDILVSAEDFMLVMLNLLQNSIEELRDARVAKPTIHIKSETACNGFIQISVEDNGPSYRHDGPERIFSEHNCSPPATRHYRTAICNWILEDYGGNLCLTDSAASQGTKVCFTMPAP